MAALSASALCAASPSIAFSKGFSGQQLCSQQAPLPAMSRSQTQGRQHRMTCIKAVKQNSERVAIDTRRHKGALVGALLPSVAAMLIGSTSFVPEAMAEMSSAEYYRSLLESVRKNKAEAPHSISAPVAAPPLVDETVAAAPSPVISAIPVSSKAAASADVDFSSLFSSSLLESPKQKEAEPKEEESSGPSLTELRAKRVAEVAKKEREEAEQKAKEAKAQAEARAKDSAAKAEEETQKKAKEAKEAADKIKSKQAEEAKKVASVAQSKKTHGYLPLFLAQFLVLGLYAGVIVLTFFLPQSQSNKIKATLNELWAKVSPLVEQAQPYADKAVVAGNSLARKAQPYLGKAAREAVPLAKKAVETAKPIVEEATAKVGTAFKKATARQD